MDHLFDDFSKSLSESVPRRESLRRLGAMFAGGLLAPLAVGTAWARAAKGRPPADPCQAFCKCGDKSRQDQCLAACRACGGNTSRLCGSCGTYACCTSPGSACCSGRCIDLLWDDDNCGACGNVCPESGPNEYIYCNGGGVCVRQCVGGVDCNGTCTAFCPAGPNERGWAVCIDGEGGCEYACVEGAVRCDGTCTFLEYDPDNCGACGHACADGDVCGGGGCFPLPDDCRGPDFAWCDGYCALIAADQAHCGACHNACGETENCVMGICINICTGCDWYY